MPFGPAMFLSIGGVFLIVHIVSTYSALARIIMETGAMSAHRVLDEEKEDDMNPSELAEELLKRTREARLNDIPINRKYRLVNKHYNDSVRRNSVFLNDIGGFAIDEIADVDLAD